MFGSPRGKITLRPDLPRLLFPSASGWLVHTCFFQPKEKKERKKRLGTVARCCSMMARRGSGAQHGGWICAPKSPTDLSSGGCMVQSFAGIQIIRSLDRAAMSLSTHHLVFRDVSSLSLAISKPWHGFHIFISLNLFQFRFFLCCKLLVYSRTKMEEIKN